MVNTIEEFKEILTSELHSFREEIETLQGKRNNLRVTELAELYKLKGKREIIVELLENIE